MPPSLVERPTLHSTAPGQNRQIGQHDLPTSIASFSSKNYLSRCTPTIIQRHLGMAAPTDLIKAAFDHAIRDFKATLGDEKLLEDISKTTSIKDVYNTTDALQKEQAEKGRLRHLAKIQPLLEGLRSYASVIEVFVQSKQDVLSLI